jgi:predicted nucleotidyltransferase
MNQYGQELFSAIETVQFTATIVEDQENIFVPARYLVGEISPEEGNIELPGFTEVITFEGVFASVFNTGDRVRVRGTAEAVRDADGNLIRNQVVVGTLGTQGWIIRLPVE